MNKRQALRAEDYLITILEICERTDARAKTGLVANQLGVANGTASTVIKQLARVGYVDQEPYDGAVLTMSGKRKADAVRARRLSIEQFLDATLAPFERSASECEARLIEQVATDELLKAIESFLDSLSRFRR